jgi:hypothetical protein
MHAKSMGKDGRWQAEKHSPYRVVARAPLMVLVRGCQLTGLAVAAFTVVPQQVQRLSMDVSAYQTHKLPGGAFWQMR